MIVHEPPLIALGPAEYRRSSDDVAWGWARSKDSPARRWLPYGAYLLADGSEVLFNRDYCPLWRRGPVEAKHDEIIDYVARKWFFKAGFILGLAYPQFQREAEKRALAVLREWGVDRGVIPISRAYLYRAFDAEARLLYVGVSFNAMVRLSQHMRSASWFDEVTNIQIERFDSRVLAGRRRSPLPESSRKLSSARARCSTC